MDWSKNEYFNCSSPSVERCGVPFSCCMNATDISVSHYNLCQVFHVEDNYRVPCVCVVINPWMELFLNLKTFCSKQIQDQTDSCSSDALDLYLLGICVCSGY